MKNPRSDPHDLEKSQENEVGGFLAQFADVVAAGLALDPHG